MYEKNFNVKIGFIDNITGVSDLDFVSYIRINYDDIYIKEDIFIGITKLLFNSPEDSTYFVYDTNITSIPKIYSDSFELEFYKSSNKSCNFKLPNNKSNLLLFCNRLNSSETDFYLGNITNEIILTNIHYKYNFRIQPVENNELVSYVWESGYIMEAVYPNVLDFSLDTNLNLIYITEYPSRIYTIQLNPNSSPLKCNNLIYAKICTVPISYFRNLELDYYYTYHRNSYHYNLLFINYEIPPIKIIIPETDIYLYILYSNLQYIGKEGFLYFITNYDDTKKNIFNPEDIEEKTNFTTTITVDKENKYIVNCRLWKPTNEKIRIFCDLEEMLEVGSHNLYFDSANIKYNNYTIHIISLTENIEAYQYNISIPFIYSDKQVINVEDEKEVYELKFKIRKYNNEVLILYSKEVDYIALDKSRIEGNNLIFTIEKEKLVEILYSNNQSFIINYCSIFTGTISFDSIFGITVKSNYKSKIDIYIGITKLLRNIYSRDEFVVYETNITSIDNIISDIFPFTFGNEKFGCHFKKSEKVNLLFLCLGIKVEGSFSLGEIKKEIRYDNINIKYNLVITPVSNSEIFTIDDHGSYGLLVYPDKLDFTLKDNLTID